MFGHCECRLAEVPSLFKAVQIAALSLAVRVSSHQQFMPTVTEIGILQGKMQSSRCCGKNLFG